MSKLKAWNLDIRHGLRREYDIKYISNYTSFFTQKISSTEMSPFVAFET